MSDLDEDNMPAELDEGDNKTIFSGDLSPDEKAAVQKGEARGKKAAMQEYPKRYGLARQRGLGRKEYEATMSRVNGGTERPLNIWPRDKNGNLTDD